MINYNLINTIPDSDSDRLLKEWGYDLKKDYCDIIQSADIPYNEIVLDLATGTGRICAVLTRFGYQLITGDNSQKDINKARARITSPYLKQVTFISLNMEKLPFSNSSVDHIICINTLHELDNPKLCLNEIMRIHSGKGKLVISDFNTKGFELMQRIHENIYGNDHRTGLMGMEIVEKVLRSKYKNVISLYTELNQSFIVTQKN